MASSRLVRGLFALFAYSCVFWAARNWRRALFWDALMLAGVMASFWIPIWLLLLLSIAQAIDAMTFEPVREPFTTELWAACGIATFIAVPTALALRTHWIEAFKIPSGSMIPTLQIGDHMLVAKSAHAPNRGEVAVFVYPKEPRFDFVDRVVAVGGDTIEVREDQLIVNGRPVPRTHADGPCAYDDYDEDGGSWRTVACDAWDETLDGHTYRVVYDRDSHPHSFPPHTLAPNSYFVMGDNRDNAYDSRFWGTVPQANVKGVARKIAWSSGPHGVRWGRIDRPIR